MRITPSQRAAADDLFVRSDRWARGCARTATGDVIGVVLFASETAPGTVWITRCDGRGCNCPGAQRSRSGICRHQIAVRQDVERARNREWPVEDDGADLGLVNLF